MEGKKIKFWKVKNIKEEDLIEIYPELKEYENKLKEIDAGTILFANEKKGLFIKANEGIIQVEEIQGVNAKKCQ